MDQRMGQCNHAKTQRCDSEQNLCDLEIYDEYATKCKIFKIFKTCPDVHNAIIIILLRLSLARIGHMYTCTVLDSLPLKATFSPL